MAKSKCTCTICGTQFAPKPRKANIYCGMDCYRVAQRRGDYKRGTKRIHKCSHCGAPVEGVSHNRKRNGDRADHIFCNRDCYDAFRRVSVERVYGYCKGCDAPLSRATTGRTAATYCSHECRVSHKKAEPKHCLACKCWFTPIKMHSGMGKMISYNAGKTCSAECHVKWISLNEARKEKISKAFTGERHPNWQGGPQMRDRGARGGGWQRARRAALKRDKHVCQHCCVTEAEHKETTGKGLEVHHKVPFWQYRGDNAKANALSNLVSLCKSCHQKADWEYRRQNPVQMGMMF